MVEHKRSIKFYILGSSKQQQGVAENQKFYLGKFFYQGKGTLGGVILIIQTFFKAKNSLL